MHLTIRCVCAAAMVSLLAAACSSGNSKDVADSGADLGTGGHGSGGHGSGGGSATGGGSSAPMCAADTGGDSCRKCLANNCCDAYTTCVGDPKCDKALTTQITCFTSGDEPSFCFGNFARALGGDAGTITPVPACIVTSCTAVCGGPGIV